MRRGLRYLFLPPGCLVGLGLVGVWLLRRHPRQGRGLILLSLGLLYLLAIPPVELALHWSLEFDPPLPLQAPLGSQAQAIVILGGGSQQDAPDWGHPIPSWQTLLRVRYGASLARRTDLPVLVSSGGEGVSEAEVMAQALEELGIPRTRVWLEDRSRNTFENSLFSARMLKERGVSRVVLVTQSFHMARARWCFERAGLEVVAAPCDPGRAGPWERGLFAFIPTATTLLYSEQALEEWGSLILYRVFYHESAWSQRGR